jgi:hypothetical protein
MNVHTAGDDGRVPAARSVFGPLKATARRLFRQHLYLHAGDPHAAGKRQAAQLLIESWNALSEAIRAGWALFAEGLRE